MSVAHVNGIDIWYERSGGSGPTLALTHGFAAPSSTGWPAVIQDFREHFDLLLYDVRAHGKTAVPDDPSTFTLPQCAADLAGLMDLLAIDRAHIGGVSMGGMISAQFACDYPARVRSLSLCDTTAGNGGGADAAAKRAEAWLSSVFERFDYVVEKYGTAGLVERENRHRHDGDKYAHLAATSLEEQDDKNRRMKCEAMTQAGYLAANRGIRTRPDLTSRTPQITAPTMVSCGEWDDFLPCALRDHALIPNSRMVTIPRAAHATPDYQPELWKQAIFDFIAGVDVGSR